MKIGFVLDDRLDKPDGVQQYVSLVGFWLSLQGHDVHYLVGHSPAATQKNVHNISKTVSVRFNKNRMAIPLPANKAKIRALLIKENFDVLHVQMPYSPFLAGRVVSAAGPRTAVVGTFHILPHGILSSAGTRALGLLLHKNKQKFAGFISVSSAAKLFAKSHFGIDSTVLPNVVSLEKYRKGKPLKQYANKKNIVFLGRFVERKGAQFSIAAYTQLIADYPALADTTRLILCGDGPDRQKLEEQASQVGADAEVIFTGFLKEEEKADYLASADVAVFPATGGESFGIVLIEAMAASAGVVLGGDNDGYKTVLDSEPLSLVHPQATNEFKDRLYTLLTNAQAHSTLHESQAEIVKRYDIEYVGPKIVIFYNEALAHISTTMDN